MTALPFLPPQAWEFDGEQEDASSSPASSPHDNGNPARGLANDHHPSRRSRARHSDDAARRRTRRRTRDRSRFSDFDEQDAREFFERRAYDNPSMPVGAVGGGAGARDSRGSSSSSNSRNTGVFEPRLGQQRPPKTNQDAADAAGAGVVAALMEVGTPVDQYVQ